jgi:hypothetical protein
MPPLVPGFVLTGGPSASATGSRWSAVRSLDGLRCAVRVLPVADLPTAQALATRQLAICEQVGNEHLLRQRAVVALADGTLALVVDEVGGVSLAQLLGARAQLTTGETVTTVAPLFGALADLHAAGMVHGDLAPGSIEFTTDGRPMICDLGVAGLLDTPARPSPTEAGRGFGAPTGGFEAPEITEGAPPTPRSDVYAMGALAWFCLTGAPPGPAATRQLLNTLLPATPPRLAEILAACLHADPARRPSADRAAAEVFDAAPAESVALAAVPDPAAEITRRIRSAAASPAGSASRVPKARHVPRLAIAGAVLGVVGAVGAGATWFALSQPTHPRQAGAGSTSHLRAGLDAKAISGATLPFPLAAPPSRMARTASSLTRTAPTSIARGGIAATPQVAPARLLQALVDARALAYVARSAPLLDLVYAAEAPKADVDRANIAVALKNGGTYLGLSFVVRDVAFLAGTSETARIRATIVTPAYRTGQPDGRKIPHPAETLGPCVFTVRLTPDGWRVLALSAPTSAR